MSITQKEKDLSNPEWYLGTTLHNIKNRCTNKDNPGYKHWGGRGISVFPKWLESNQLFYDWIRDNIGERPDNTFSLDRIDNNGNYEPGNLRWATYTEQANNRRKRYSVLYGGELMNQSQLAIKLGISHQRVNQLRKKHSNKYDIVFL